jgi:hypothetical protein
MVQGRWYRGDCHIHSVHTVEGGLTPAQLISAARDAGLDFIATTGHNTADEHDAWVPYGQDGLLVILGQEVVTSTGHWLALGLNPGQVVDWRYGVRDGLVGAQVARVHDAGGLTVAAHPHAPYPSGVFMYSYDSFDVVEVWNGLWASDLPWQADNGAAVAEWGRTLGEDIHNARWRPAMGNSDTHFTGQLGSPQTVVWAERLSVTAILAGLRRGRCWVAESSTVHLGVTVQAGGRTAGLGQVLRSDGAPIEVRVELEGVLDATVALHTDRGRVHESTGPLTWQTIATESAFVRVEVRHESGALAALSNPVILT